MTPTPGLVLGPFYPLHPPAGADHRLWRGGAPGSGARRLRLEGHVRDRGGRAVEGAWVELWHADPNGAYRHPSAPATASLADDFVGYGKVRTGADGSFAFDSLVPGAYVAGAARRAAHLHLQVTGHHDRLVTQLFLPDDPGRSEDRWYRATEHPERLLPEASNRQDGSLLLRWVAVLARG